MYTSQPFTIGFIGLGLIGGSIAKSIRRIFPDYRILAYDVDAAALEEAIADGTVHIALSEINEQIADCTLCFLTYITMALEKRFSEYETMGELFTDMEENLMALTLWKRVLACIKRLLEVLCEHLGVTVDEMIESLINDEEAASAYLIMAKP